MYTDPGWAAAVKWGLVGVFTRRRVFTMRPAITAARAMILAGIFSLLAIQLVLLVLGEYESEDAWWTMIVVGAEAVLASATVTWIRYRPQWSKKPDWDDVDLFVRHVTLLSAFAMTPAMVGFVCFFLGGGYEVYFLGMSVSLVLLLGPGRPSEDLADRLAATNGTALSGPEIWEALFRP